MWNWIDSAQARDYWRNPCKCFIRPTGFITHWVI